MARCEKQSVISPINVFLNCKAVRYLQKEEQGFFLVQLFGLHYLKPTDLLLCNACLPETLSNLINK